MRCVWFWMLLLFYKTTIPVFSQQRKQVLSSGQLETEWKGKGLIGPFRAEQIEVLKSAGIWISATDAQGNHYVAISTYDTVYSDFFPGPIDKSKGIADDTTLWNFVWKVEQKQIDQHKLSFRIPTYQAPWDLQNWPANPKTNGDFLPILAPFVDLNQNNSYEPQNGEIPYIEGSAATYSILNDSFAAHLQSLGSALGIELYLQAYVLPDPVFENAVFFKMVILNRSNRAYSQVKLGIFNDFSLGNPNDNYVSTDSVRNMILVYNGETVDQGYFGANPPVLGLAFLNQPLGHSISFDKSTGPEGWPINPEEIEGLLNGRFRDGSPLLDPVSFQQKFHYLGNPCLGTGWTEAGSLTPVPGHRMMLASTAEFTLPQDSGFVLVAAYLYGRSGNNTLDQICALSDKLDSLQKDWDLLLNTASITKPNMPQSQVYPNPFTHELKVITPAGAWVQLTNNLGKVFWEGEIADELNLKTTEWPQGIYHLQIKPKDSGRIIHHLLVK